MSTQPAFTTQTPLPSGAAMPPPVVAGRLGAMGGNYRGNYTGTNVSTQPPKAAKATQPAQDVTRRIRNPLSSIKLGPTPVNRTVIVCGMVIVLSGIGHVMLRDVATTNPADAVNGAISKPSRDAIKVALGGYVFILIISILDLFGPNMQKLTSSMALLAATTVILSTGFWTFLKSLIGL